MIEMEKAEKKKKKKKTGRRILKMGKERKSRGNESEGKHRNLLSSLASSLTVLFVLIALNLPYQEKQQVSFLQAKGI